MSFARIRRTRIDQLVDEGHKAALIAQYALKNPDRFISASQLGITLSTLALGAVGENVFAADLVTFIVSAGNFGAATPAITGAVRAGCYIVAFTVTALLQTVFGELIPKTLTFQRPEQVLLMFIWPMQFWQWLASPIINLLNFFTSFSLKLLNVKDPPRHHFVHSEEELKMLVAASHEEGVIEEEEQEMLHSVFDFADTVAQEVMTPRTDMVGIPAHSSVKEFVDLALKHGRTRIPVFEKDIDSIFGFVHVKDAVEALMANKPSNHIRELARKVLIVPENKNLGVLLKEFKKTKTHMAIVVDEYGGTRGLVTIQDLVEELVGDIADEHEIVEEAIVRQEDGSYLLDAKLSLDEANEKLGLEIKDSEFNTLAGHVFGLLGRQPHAGDEVGEGDYVLRIEAADRQRITKLRLTRKSKGSADSSPEHDTGDGTRSKEAAGQTSAAVESSK